MKKFIEEFKAFALKGNMLEMAIGIIIGGAFTNIVKALTDNIINPILNFVTGAAAYTLSDVAGFAVSFASALVNFFIMAFILFCMLKVMNKLMSIGRKKDAEASPTTKTCPFCRSEIAIEATRCPHCTSILEEETSENEAEEKRQNDGEENANTAG